MNKKLLVIYNVCGIKFNNTDMWLNHLQDILNQNYPSTIIAISGCCVSDDSKNLFLELKNQYSNLICNFIEDKLPVNITFNLTAQLCTQKFGIFDGYVYVASDVKFGSNKEILNSLSNLHFSINSGMTYALVNNDHGLEEYYINNLENTNLYLNIGKTANMHVILFDKDIYVKYNTKIVPDIFATHCTEETYTYLTAAINKKVTIHNKSIILNHIGYADGHSVGFMDEIGWNHKLAWKHLFKSKITAEERLLNNEAKKVGFGYVPSYGGFSHDTSCYDNEENHKNPEKLFNFLKTALYLSEDEFDYKNISHNIL